MVTKLSRDNQHISEDRQRLYSAKAKLDFVGELLGSVKPASLPIDIATSLAANWQKHFQTGPACVYLQAGFGRKWTEAVTIDVAGKIKTTVLDLDDDTVAMPPQLQKKCTVINDCSCIDWLFDKIDIKFNHASTKLVPLLAGSKPIGAIVFEQRLPLELDRQIDIFSQAASFAAGIITLAFTSMDQQVMAERFAELLEKSHTSDDEQTPQQLLDGIAEMAAGAAHELNNPLAVISGRTQILLDAETDDKKRKVLDQINDKAQEVSAIITGLMAFARPKQPACQSLPFRQLLDGAIAVAVKQCNTPLAIRFDNIDNLGPVCVDSQQMTEAIANIISNAVQSYADDSEDVIISGNCQQPDSTVSFQVIDTGCGMDTKTLAKATEPFFSGKPAGRQRGMGLAFAQRILLLNNAAMEIASQPDSGTTVTVSLPAAK